MRICGCSERPRTDALVLDRCSVIVRGDGTMSINSGYVGELRRVSRCVSLICLG
jgi:hypothetical protein